MPKSEDGQYELVLENRQVLVIFLFATVLCGLFFGLGFIVGQSSKGGSAVAKLESAVTGEHSSGGKKSALSPVDRPPSATHETPAQETPAATPAATDPDPKATEMRAEEAKLEAERIAADKAAAKALKADEKRAAAAVNPAPGPAAGAPPASAAGQSAQSPPVSAEGGQYNLQVAAFSTHEEAEPMAALLKRKNFPATIVPGSNDKLLHVLVGPYSTLRDANYVKTRLEAEGFKPLVKK